MNPTINEFLKTRKIEVEKTISSSELFRSKSDNEQYDLKLKEELLEQSVAEYLKKFNTYSYLMQQLNQYDTTVKSTVYILTPKDIMQLLSLIQS